MWLASDLSGKSCCLDYFCHSLWENWIGTSLVTVVIALTSHRCFRTLYSRAAMWTLFGFFLLLRVRKGTQTLGGHLGNLRVHDNDYLLCQTKFQPDLHLMEIKHLSSAKRVVNLVHLNQIIHTCC